MSTLPGRSTSCRWSPITIVAVLGVNFNHVDAAVGLLVAGKLTAAVAEERFVTRTKHDSRFCEAAIRLVFEMSGIAPRDLAHVAVARDTRANRFG
jgi:carbamoyltransferase